MAVLLVKQIQKDFSLIWKQFVIELKNLMYHVNLLIQEIGEII